jgi:hypothetical protein
MHSNRLPGVVFPASMATIAYCSNGRSMMFWINILLEYILSNDTIPSPSFLLLSQLAPTATPVWIVDISNFVCAQRCHAKADAINAYAR